MSRSMIRRSLLAGLRVVEVFWREAMHFQRSDDSWIVSVRKKDFAPTAGKSNAPANITIGTINEHTGVLDPWPMAYGAPSLSAQRRSRPSDDFWKEMALLQLRKAADSADFQRARHAHRHEEHRTGDFIVRLSDGREDAFHTFPKARDWAEKTLHEMASGARAEFFRRPLKGATPRPGGPETEPFHAMEVNEHGRVIMANLHRERRSGQFVSSRPWIVFKQTPKGIRFLSRFVNETRASEHAREEGATARHINELSVEQRRQLGLHG